MCQELGTELADDLVQRHKKEDPRWTHKFIKE